MYVGQSLPATRVEDGFVELCFDRQDEPITKFDQRTIAQLHQRVACIAAAAGVRGLLVTSAKTCSLWARISRSSARRSSSRSPNSLPASAAPTKRTRCDALRVHGPMYEPSSRMRHMASESAIFYG
jgi:hypothetical protein